MSRTQEDQMHNRIIFLKKHINVGTVIALFFIVYLIFQIIRVANLEPLKVYEVQLGTIDNNIYGTGLILRQEQLSSFVNGGHVNYYVREGDRVNQNSIVYSTNSIGNISDIMLDDNGETLKFSYENYNRINNRIQLYQEGYSDVKFKEIYEFKYAMENQIVEMVNAEILSQLGNQALVQGNYTQCLSEYSGVITYYVDGYENYTWEDVNINLFNQEQYKKRHLNYGNSSMVEETGAITNIAGEPAYKVITSELWDIYLPVSEEDAKRIEDDTRATIRLPGIAHNVYCDLSLIHSGDYYFARLSLDRYMVNYWNQRFIDVELIMEQEEGYSVPTKSIKTKNILMIPEAYFVASSNDQTKDSLIVSKMNEKGEIVDETVKVTIFSSGEGYNYVDLDATTLSNEDLILNPTNNERMQVHLFGRQEMLGVYLINNGISTFVSVSPIGEYGEFTLVSASENNSITLYDRIVLNPDLVMDGQFIQ